jgi:hypothetical protein
MSEHEVKIYPGYALRQLARALANPASTEKVRRWTQILNGLATGTLDVGDRTPVKGVPAWATLEVATGGFATGSLVAGGALLPHEIALLDRLGRPHATSERAAINTFYLGDTGRRELEAPLASGCYRVNVAEEGGLLVVAWLLAQGHADRASKVLDAIVPFFDRIRFYPTPDAEPIVETGLVSLSSVPQVADAVAKIRAPAPLLAMNEALLVWLPLYDRAVALWLETAKAGVPCQVWPDGFRERAAALVADHERARAEHTLCRGREGYTRLVQRLEVVAMHGPDTLTAGDVRTISNVVASVVKRHGESARPAALRAEQTRIASRPTFESISRVVVTRLRAQEGMTLASRDVVCGPLSAADAARSGLPEGTTIPAGAARKVDRCVPATIRDLIANGLIPSATVLAKVLPQITSHIHARSLEDAALRGLFAAIQAAFRKRRSLLLLHLQHQVRAEELPWVSEIADLRAPGSDAASTARASFAEVATLALTHFPEAIVPNELLTELRGLAKSGALEIPIVDEVAADIFRGTFTRKFVEAARIAGRVLGPSSLYARYYGIPFERVMTIDDFTTKSHHAAPSSAAFAALCVQLAEPGGRGVAANGKVIEQQQILTTQNLATLVDAAHLHLPHRELADTCFRWICRRLQVRTTHRHAQLIARKNCAYAWRQMIFYLSFVSPAELEAFLVAAREHLASRRQPFAARFEPALAGLEYVARGGSAPPARFLGWVTTPTHWLD